MKKVLISLAACLLVVVIAVVWACRPKPPPQFVWSFLGFTNVNGKAVALVRIKNVGGQTVGWHGQSFQLTAKANTETTYASWPKNFQPRLQMKAGEFQDLRFSLPPETQQWSILFLYDVASLQGPLGDIWESPLRRFIPDGLWELSPKLSFESYDASSPIFTNTPPSNVASSWGQDSGR